MAELYDVSAPSIISGLCVAAFGGDNSIVLYLPEDKGINQAHWLRPMSWQGKEISHCFNGELKNQSIKFQLSSANTYLSFSTISLRPLAFRRAVPLERSIWHSDSFRN